MWIIYQKIFTRELAIYISKKIIQKKISENLWVQASQLTRIENEEINKFADYYGASSDFLLGRTNIKIPKNVVLNKLGMSNKALLTLLSRKIDTQLLNRMMDHNDFIPMMAYAEPQEDISSDEFQNQIK